MASLDEMPPISTSARCAPPATSDPVVRHVHGPPIQRQSCPVEGNPAFRRHGGSLASDRFLVPMIDDRRTRASYPFEISRISDHCLRRRGLSLAGRGKWSATGMGDRTASPGRGTSGSRKTGTWVPPPECHRLRVRRRHRGRAAFLMTAGAAGIRLLDARPHRIGRAGAGCRTMLTLQSAFFATLLQILRSRNRRPRPRSERYPILTGCARVAWVRSAARRPRSWTQTPATAATTIAIKELTAVLAGSRA